MNPLRWRKVTWALDLWIGAFVIWMIAGVNSSSNCEPYPTGNFFEPGTAYCGIESEIRGGQTMAFLVWCVGFVVLSFAWLMTSGRARPQR
jgi:hypothetical protein